MIGKNLGNAERIVRLLMGVFFGIWTMQQPSMNAIDWLVMIVCLALVLNGVFSRCYLWYILDKNSVMDEASQNKTGVC